MNHQEMSLAIDRSHHAAAERLRSDQLAGRNAMVVRHNDLLDEVERQRQKQERRANATHALGVQVVGRELITTAPPVQVEEIEVVAA